MLDPVPPLRALLDLPLRTQVEPAIAQRLAELDKQTKAPPPEGWTGIYKQAQEIAEKLVADYDTRMSNLQRRQLEIDEAVERQRAQGGPRRQLDSARQELRQLSSRLKQDWRGRLQRQAEQVNSGVATAVAALKVEVARGHEGPEVRLPPEHLLELNGHVERLCQDWRTQLGDKAATELSQKVPALLAGIKDLGPAPPPPPFQPSPAERVQLSSPPQPFELPSFGGALWEYIRSHVMMVAMFGTTLLTPVLLFVGTGSGGARPMGMMQLRAWMMLFLLPPALVLGSLAARKQRKTVVEKAKASKQQAIAGALVADAGKVVARQSAELERTLGQYFDQACAAEEAWLEKAAESKVAVAESAEQEKVRALRLESRQVQEAQGELRMVRNQVAQTVMPELRRRLRDLSEASAH